MKALGEDNHLETKERPGTDPSLVALKETDPADKLISDCQPPELRKSTSAAKPSVCGACYASPREINTEGGRYRVPILLEFALKQTQKRKQKTFYYGRSHHT